MYKTVSSVLLILLFCIGIVLLGYFYQSYDVDRWPNDYAVVIDAGSSGTRGFLYEWKADFSAAKGDHLVVYQKATCKSNDDGIDKLKSKAEFIENISPCLETLQEEIPQDRMKRTYIFLAATAGMRLLDAQNKTASNEIFGYIREFFKDETDFLFKNDSQVRILGGQEEGTDAWISANYYNNNFKQQNPKVVKKTSDTTGVLDLGGASTQIVYVPESANLAHSSYFSNIRIYGVDYKPYSYSFLCWGQNEIALLYQTYLIYKGDFNMKTSSSCYPTSYTKNIDSYDIFKSPCANGILTNNTLEFTKETSKIKKDSTYMFEGFESSFENCREEVSHLFSKSECKYESCSFNGVYMPSVSKSNIMGFSGFYYSVQNTEKLYNIKLSDNYTLYMEKTTNLCSLKYDELNKLNEESGAELKETYLINQCFTNIYILELLANYGINSFNDLTITNKVNSYSLNWALGYLINELNRDHFLPYEEPPRKLELRVFAPLTVIFSLAVIVLVVGLLYYKLRFKKKNQRTMSMNEHPIVTIHSQDNDKMLEETNS